MIVALQRLTQPIQGYTIKLYMVLIVWFWASALTGITGVIAGVAPMRVVSINLCADELAMLLSAPGQLQSVTWLGADAEETPLAYKAKTLVINHALAEEVLALKPDLVLAGPGARLSKAILLKRADINVVEVPIVENFSDVSANTMRVAMALGHPERGRALIKWMNATLPKAARQHRDTLVVQSGGLTIKQNSVAASFLGYAGIKLMDDHADSGSGVEALLRHPPQLIISANYRKSQRALGTMWLQNPALKSITARIPTVSIDSRSFTCMSPIVAADMADLNRRLEVIP